LEFTKKLKDISKQYDIKIDTYAVSCVPHKSVCTGEDVSSYPKIKLYLDGSTQGTFINYWELHPFQILRSIGFEVDMPEEDFDVSSEEAIDPNGDVDRKDGTSEAHFLPRTKKDIYNDAYLSFDFAMKNAIFIGEGPLTNSTREAFENFMYLAQATLPPTFGLQYMISEIVSNMEKVVESEENLLAIVNRFPPKKKSWSPSCTRGDPMAGYTCGLWELFHIMSMGLVEWNTMVIGDDWSYYRPEDSGESLRNYIEHFFGCEVCRLNFLHAYDACAYDRCNRLTKFVGEVDDWIELPMWLFETHNGVNVRLMKERAEREKRVPDREDEIAVQWPSRKDCPTCWHGDGRWDQANVYMFLRLTYWPEDGISPKLRRLLYAVDPDDDKDEEGSTKWVMLLLLVASMGASGATWYKKRQQVARTGRHKKVDGPTMVYHTVP
jgi:hypothetical protein